MTRCLATPRIRPNPPASPALPALLAVLLASAAALAGCQDMAGDALDASYAEYGYVGADPTGRDPDAWPDLDGRTVTILDHGAFSAFDDAAAAFTALTNATVVHLEADDAGSALNRAILERGSPSADVLYGIDNVLLPRALEAGILHPYTPLLAGRVAPDHVFFDADGPWPATPVDHGFVAVNVDHSHPSLAGRNVSTLDDVRREAGLFVTQDPTTSSVGLGFLLATIATYGEDGWQGHWEDLFEGGVTVTAGWTEAYEGRFSGGYGVAYGGRGDKPIVTSYSQSPAYEAFYGRPAGQLADVVVAPRSTFQQVQTMAILRGAQDLVAAQAWVEFTLTDAFQELAAPGNAVYPVVAAVDTNATYGDVDPEPGSFETARFTQAELGSRLEGWLRAWTDLCERHGCR